MAASSASSAGVVIPKASGLGVDPPGEDLNCQTVVYPYQYKIDVPNDISPRYLKEVMGIHGLKIRWYKFGIILLLQDIMPYTYPDEMAEYLNANPDDKKLIGEEWINEVLSLTGDQIQKMIEQHRSTLRELCSPTICTRTRLGQYFFELWRYELIKWCYHYKTEMLPWEDLPEDYRNLMLAHIKNKEERKARGIID